MKFVLTGYGSRGDVEPCVALGIELRHRGHHVRMAVAPAAVRRVNALGLSASAYGADLSAFRPLLQDASFILGIADKMNDSQAVLHEVMEFVMPIWTAKTAQLIELANDADLLVAGITEQEIAANVAESRGISVAALHLFPAHVLAQSQFRQQVLSLANAAQRRALGLPEASKVRTTPLEIQAYDRAAFLSFSRLDATESSAVRRRTQARIVAVNRLRNVSVDGRWNATDLLWVRQHADRVASQSGGDHRGGVRGDR